jgi:hypothetical protein
MAWTRGFQMRKTSTRKEIQQDKPQEALVRPHCYVIVLVLGVMSNKSDVIASSKIITKVLNVNTVQLFKVLGQVVSTQVT